MPLSLLDMKNDNAKLKVNFFADYYNLLYKNKGAYLYWDFDMPLTLTSKIIFQIETNPEHRIKYINEYFKSTYFKPNGFTSQFESHNKIQPLIDKYRTAKNDKEKNKYIESSQMLEVLKKLEEELKDKQLEITTRYITNYLQCQHDLDFHKNDIFFLTKVILCELLFAELPRWKLQHLVSILMSKNKYEFPLPSTILQKKGKEDFEKTIDTFFKQRNFSDQLQGILNLKERANRVGFYLIRIYNLAIPVDKVFKYQDVEIRSPQNDKFNAFLQEQNRPEWIEYVIQSDISIAIVEDDFSNHELGFKSAINKVQSTVNYINNNLNVNCSIDIFENRITIDFQNLSSQSILPAKTNVTNRELQILQNDNPFEILDNIKSDAKNQFLSAEYLYQRAIKSNDPTDYWIYLEILIPKRMNQNGRYKNYVQKTSAHLLLLSYKKEYPVHITDQIISLLDGFSQNETNYSLAHNDILDLLQERTPFKVIKKTKKFCKQHPIINELHFVYAQRNTVLYKRSEFEFYQREMKELYMHRNSSIHSGIVNTYSEKKLSIIIPIFVKRIRTVLLHKIKSHKIKNLNSIIEIAISEAENYLY